MEGVKLGKGKTFFSQASVLKRLIAFLIDIAIIIYIISLPFILIIFIRIVPETASISEKINILNNSPVAQIVYFFIFLIVLLYFMRLEMKLNQTPGKILFNLYVKSQTKDLKYWQLFVRSMFLIPLFPFVLLWIIDPIVMFFTKENQRLSEILSKTKVVEKYKI